jgi:hypothetical protein
MIDANEVAQDFFTAAPKYRTKDFLISLITDAAQRAKIGEIVSLDLPLHESFQRAQLSDETRFKRKVPPLSTDEQLVGVGVLMRENALLRASIKHWQGVASQGIQVERQLRERLIAIEGARK